MYSATAVGVVSAGVLAPAGLKQVRKKAQQKACSVQPTAASSHVQGQYLDIYMQSPPRGCTLENEGAILHKQVLQLIDFTSN